MPIPKLSAQNNGWIEKESKLFRRNSVISQMLHWLDWNRQLWSKDIYYIGALRVHIRNSQSMVPPLGSSLPVLDAVESQPAAIKVSVDWVATISCMTTPAISIPDLPDSS